MYLNRSLSLSLFFKCNIQFYTITLYVRRANEDSNNNVKNKKRLERKNSHAHTLEAVSKLNPPAIPDFGQYFDVHVTLAAHPRHFIVQPLNSSNQLKVF